MKHEWSAPEKEFNLSEKEKLSFDEAVRRSRGNLDRAAKILGVDVYEARRMRERMGGWGHDVLTCERCGTTAFRTGTGCLFRHTGGAPEPVHPDCDVQAAKMVLAS